MSSNYFLNFLFFVLICTVNVRLLHKENKANSKPTEKRYIIIIIMIIIIIVILTREKSSLAKNVNTSEES